MKGLKHKFTKELKKHGIKAIISNKWFCDFKSKKLHVPSQSSEMNIFYGLHELAHYVLHRNDKRDYDNLHDRIHIEVEADNWAIGKLKEICGRNTSIAIANNYTLGLIALYLQNGNQYLNFQIEIDDEFVILKRHGIEIFSQFTSNLPMHPAI